MRKTKSHFPPKKLSMKRKKDAPKLKVVYYDSLEGQQFLSKSKTYTNLKVIRKESNREVGKMLHKRICKSFECLLNNEYLENQFIFSNKEWKLSSHVKRVLLGDRGVTSCYLGSRNFAIEGWGEYLSDPPKQDTVVLSATEIYCSFQDAYEYFHRKKNDHREGISANIAAFEELKLSLQKICDEHRKLNFSKLAGDNLDPPPLNVVIINYFSNSNSGFRSLEPYCKNSTPKYQVLHWHRDKNLPYNSDIATYSYNYKGERKPVEKDHNGDCANELKIDKMKETHWSVSLKIPWDTKNPVLNISLQSGDTYFFLGDFNDTHQHTLLSTSQSGDCPGGRFSATYRCARLDCDQWQNMWAKLSKVFTADLFMDSNSSKFLRYLELRLVIEFDWLRQFWVNGLKHAFLRYSWVLKMRDAEKFMEYTQDIINKIFHNYSRDTKVHIRKPAHFLIGLKKYYLARKKKLYEWQHRYNWVNSQELDYWHRPIVWIPCSMKDYKLCDESLLMVCQISNCDERLTKIIALIHSTGNMQSEN